jgi:isocitrate/isopropylmalate dehydrogenase
MLLRHSLDDDANASRIERAVERTYADGLRTTELAGSARALTTEAFAEAVVDRLKGSA